ncbi:MAG: glycosyltransferase family 4 protein [Candidatus Berkelbacteria bacterium]|nr:MAG: glycosyltransferase family 4 protein [Candidatus Berkelbacteria bacterium]QQG51667.1 MAG: glycosyltransferase family 4 protein [Candidatus Berkelbacteria bacterium]
MSKIGLDLRFWRGETGGLGRYSRNLLGELLKLDTKNNYTAIITPADEAEFSLTAPNLTKLVVPIAHYSLSEQRRLPKILNEQHFDLVHFANFNHPIFYGGKFVVTIHDLIMHVFPTGAQKDSWLRRAAYRKVMNDCKRAETIIVPSLSTKKDLVNMLNFPAAKIVVTPEGSEEKFKVATPSAIAAVKAKLNLPERYILFVSRWERYKGLPALLEAFETITQESSDVGLVITGKPDKQNPEIAALVKTKQSMGQRIVAPGFVPDDDLPALYSGAVAYVHPSWYEGFGLMILEAFSAGAPVVTSNTSSLPEVVGDAGLLVDPKKPAEIAAAVRRILSDPKFAADLRQKGLARAKEFSWAKMAAETLEIYKKVLG